MLLQAAQTEPNGFRSVALELAYTDAQTNAQESLKEFILQTGRRTNTHFRVGCSRRRLADHHWCCCQSATTVMFLPSAADWGNVFSRLQYRRSAATAAAVRHVCIVKSNSSAQAELWHRRQQMNTNTHICIRIRILLYQIWQWPSAIANAAAAEVRERTTTGTRLCAAAAWARSLCVLSSSSSSLSFLSSLLFSQSLRRSLVSSSRVFGAKITSHSPAIVAPSESQDSIYKLLIAYPTLFNIFGIFVYWSHSSTLRYSYIYIYV